MRFIKSPYIIFNKDYSISNLLTEKRLQLKGKNGIRLFNSIKELPREILTLELKERNLDIDFLLDKNIIFYSDFDPIEISFIRYASIEINTHCNNRCKFCPVSVSPLKKQFIDDELFIAILSQLKELKTIRWVSLNHYNEPFLDPKLYDKILLMKDYGLKVRLFTNGKNLKPSFFTKNLINNLDYLVLNIPTVNSRRYKEITGTKMPEDFLDSISNIIKLKLPIEIAINGKKDEAIKEKQYLDSFFNLVKYKNCHSYVNITNTRAGLLDNEYINLNNRYLGKLKGCRRFVENIAIGVNGEVFICCQDYSKNNVVGNLRDSTLSEILNSDSYLNLKKKIFGYKSAEDSFICRSCNEIIYE